MAKAETPGSDDPTMEVKHVEDTSKSPTANLVYEIDEEPELHARTWFALAAMCLLNMVQVLGLLSPPSALSYIEADLNNTVAGTWVPNSLSVVQAVFAPLIASLSDTFQARKFILVGASTISFIGAAIAPGSEDIYRLIGAQIMIGIGFATVPLAYCIPSEILPRKWRPMAQAGMNVAAVLGATSGPLIIGALTKANPSTGWRKFYWIQMALWGATALGLLFGYHPTKRHTALDHLTLREKLARIDLVGFFLLSAGIALFLTGLNLGGGIYAWSSPAVLATLIVGLVLLVVFGVYEWRFTSTGILHHDLFRGGEKRGRTFSICIGLIFIEGILLFAYVIFYPVIISTLFETDPFLQSVRQLPYWIAAAAGTILYGAWSTKRKTIRAPTMVGYILLTAGMVGFATIQPDDNLATWFFAALAGLGFGAPLILIIVGVQLSTPHHLIATATAATTCSRAIATAVFTAIASAALDIRLEEYIPEYISVAALGAGLPPDSLGLFIGAITGHGQPHDFENIAGISPAIIAAGSAALKQAYADGLRVVFIIAAPFGVVACIATFFLGDLSDVMDYAVDAPVEELHAKHRRGGTT
ncbi:major facilitator superfamily domain-containing protein [Aspergillus germanicus]